MSKKITKTRFVLGVIAAVLLAAEPLMMLWQPILPPGSYALIATLSACLRAGLTYYMNSDVGVKDEEGKKEDNFIGID
ncbi:holin [Pseudomonas phage vB_PF_Y1-MI]|nr:holin [Pseudomonas phage vB_PF_Y1-MI]